MAKTKLKRRKLVKKSAAAADATPKIEKKLKKQKKKKTKLYKSGSDSDSDPNTKIQTLLEPFSKDQLITLVTDLSLSHASLFPPQVRRRPGSHTARFLSTVSLGTPRANLLSRFLGLMLASEGPAAPGAGGIVSQQHFSSSDYPQRKIYVSNVPVNASAEKLRGFFEKFGEIENGPKGLDPTTGKFKGYAIFVFKTVEGARRVLEEPYKMFEGSQLHCQKAAEGKNKVAGGAASITTALQPVQPQMLAAVAAAQQAQNMALLGQQTGMVNPLYSGGMIANANLGALMGVIMG
ncbi:UNVERIFIED_CONTAM: UBP1-associated protein 2A [Sesamum radiatum]|uniref:UBP1-associated protein 2A n=1 Tax=Sesamum radiatum TaxID=300843 RepID=A0AAW2VSC0_SESRA